MLNFINEAIARFKSLFSRLQVKQFLPMFLVGFVLLTINNDLVPLDNQRLGRKLNNEIHQDGELRPKTNGEWNQQAMETDGRPVERLKRIVEQSGEAIKDFSNLYPEAVERGAAELSNGSK
jgi:hypothetical protein